MSLFLVLHRYARPLRGSWLLVFVFVGESKGQNQGILVTEQVQGTAILVHQKRLDTTSPDTPEAIIVCKAAGNGVCKFRSTQTKRSVARGYRSENRSFMEDSARAVARTFGVLVHRQRVVWRIKIPRRAKAFGATCCTKAGSSVSHDCPFANP